MCGLDGAMKVPMADASAIRDSTEAAVGSLAVHQLTQMC
jgi:hypothetical protein